MSPVCSSRMTISSVSLWPFPANWTYFLISFNDIRRYELFDEVVRCILFMQAFYDYNYFLVYCKNYSIPTTFDVWIICFKYLLIG